MRPCRTEPEDTAPSGATNLRRQAEEAVAAQPARQHGSLSHDEALALVHELQVHQIELELQNEELTQTRLEAEALRDRYADLYDFAPVGYFTLDEAGAIREANLAGAVQLGVDRGSLVGARFAIFLHPDSLPGFAAYCDRVLAGGTTEACDVSFAARAGRGAWHAQLRGRADGAGAAGSVRLVVTDITDRRRAEEAVREREQTLQGIVRAAPVGIGIASHRVIGSGQRARLPDDRVHPDELIGRDSRMLYPTDEAYAAVGQEKYARILESGVGAVETQWRRKDGTVLDILLSSSPIDPSRPFENVVFVALEITDLHEKEAALREYAENLQRSNEDLERFAVRLEPRPAGAAPIIVSFSQLLERRYTGQARRGRGRVHRLHRRGRQPDADPDPGPPRLLAREHDEAGAPPDRDGGRDGRGGAEPRPPAPRGRRGDHARPAAGGHWPTRSSSSRSSRTWSRTRSSSAGRTSRSGSMSAPGG